jgi:branched-chain amino acid transport system permease protein
MGAYLVWTFLQTELQLSFLLGIVVSAVIMYVFGLLVYRFTMNPLMKKPGWDISTVLFLLGGGILLENVLLQIYGPRVKAIPVLFEGTLTIGPVSIQWSDLILMVIVVAGIVALNLFFKYTRMGQAMQATAQSMPGAKVVGVNIEYIFGLTFGLAFAVTGFSGVLLSTRYFLNPHIGWEWMVKGFVIVSFGGLGSTTGAIFAGLILGIVEALVTLYLGAMWVWPIWFIIFLIVLLIRPQGILGGRV